MSPTVQIEVATRDCSLLKEPAKRPELKADPVLKFWRWMIHTAVAEAKKTESGLPTYNAILQRKWIEHEAPQSDREDWQRSFAAACSWLGLDAAAERRRVLEEIDAEWHARWMEVWSAELYQRTAVAMTCAGERRAIRRQFGLPLMSQREFEWVADVDHGDPAGWEKKVVPLAA